MSFGPFLRCIGVVVIVVGASSVAPVQAGAAGANRGNVSSLRHAAASWVKFAARGNAERACKLQTEPTVAGALCGDLPSYGEVIYCPVPRDPDDAVSPWRTYEEEVVKARVRGGAGSLTIRSEERSSRFSVKANFRKIGDRWRIASIRWGKRLLRPAGLIFTEGDKARERLWPLHC